ncbi:MAG: hypothetical protein FWG02_06975 [Holophagaceae bacterium]|nr:hypothetical protein [Holophagaceae bacterium]
MDTKTSPKFKSYEDVRRECKGKGRSLEYIRANYDQIVKEAEEEFGPHVPPQILPYLPQRGRPRSGEPVELVQTKSVRMSPAFWEEMQGLASIEGLTIHSAMRTAMVEWVEKRHGVSN